MSYMRIAIVCSNVIAGCHVNVHDYNLTKSDCISELRYHPDTALVEFKCEVDGENWEGEKFE